MIAGMQFGGQIARTMHLENYPGFAQKIDGIFLTEEMRKQAESFGAEMKMGSVVSADILKKIKILNTDGGEKIEAHSVIIATGTTPRPLGMPNEAALIGKGISYCATCDGFFFKGRDVAVVGGGNSALIESLHLSTIARTVYLVHRRNEFRAEEINVARARETENIKFITPAEIDEFITDEKGALKSLRLSVDKHEQILDVSAAFISIGTMPSTAFLGDVIELDNSGYIITEPNLTKTTVDGVFAAGDVKAPRFRQAVIAAASGAQAAMEAVDYLYTIE